MHPREIILELSHNCNLSCIMCGFQKERNQPHYFMTEETLHQVMDAIAYPPEIIRLNGRGESTIHPKFNQFLALIREKWPQSQLHLFTNLNIQDTQRVELLKKYGIQLFISIDSPNPEELAQIRRGASWEIMERNLNLLRNHQPRPYFVFTIQAENLHRIKDIAHLAATHNVGLIYNAVRSDSPDHYFLNRVISELGEIRQALVEAKKILAAESLPCLIPDQIQGVDLDLEVAHPSNGKLATCPALYREACVQYDGYVTPCNMFHPQRLGHISEGSVAEILDGAAARAFRSHHQEDSYCQNCAWLGGGE